MIEGHPLDHEAVCDSKTEKPGITYCESCPEYQAAGGRYAPRGKEAEELRAGIEGLIGSTAGSDINTGELQMLLDRVSARDSLRYGVWKDNIGSEDAEARANKEAYDDAEQLAGTELLVMRDVLKMGKYTKWAEEITADELVGLLWLVGEFGFRTCREEFSMSGVVGSERRKVAALRAIARFNREAIGVEEARELMRDSLRPQD